MSSSHLKLYKKVMDREAIQQRLFKRSKLKRQFYEALAGTLALTIVLIVVISTVVALFKGGAWLVKKDPMDPVGVGRCAGYGRVMGVEVVEVANDTDSRNPDFDCYQNKVKINDKVRQM